MLLARPNIAFVSPAFVFSPLLALYMMSTDRVKRGRLTFIAGGVSRLSRMVAKLI
jgi:hypothetical protein